jgi:hypothetical protein
MDLLSSLDLADDSSVALVSGSKIYVKMGEEIHVNGKPK